MSHLLLDILPLDYLFERSKYYLNKKFEFVFQNLSFDKRKTFGNSSILNLELKARELKIEDHPISWYCLNVIQSISVDKVSKDRRHFISKVIQHTDLLEDVIDFKTHKFESNGFKFNIPIKLNEKLNLNFGENLTLQTLEEYDKWENYFIQALEIVKSINPNIFQKLNSLVQNILVIKSSEGTHGSMSPKCLIGTIYLPDVEDSIIIAECLVHECLHQYLYRIEFAGSLFFDNDGLEELYYSPWKDNPRPLIMLLHGAFVFTGVVMFYNELSKKDLTLNQIEIFKKRMIYRYSQIRIALNGLQHHNKMSDLGNRIVQILEDELQELNFLDSQVEVDDVLDHFGNFSTVDYRHVSIK